MFQRYMYKKKQNNKKQNKKTPHILKTNDA